ncbi:MAG: hypothetical protein ACI87O_002965 [Planctomycetota bacterium]|jgi:hypothetical protein
MTSVSSAPASADHHELGRLSWLSFSLALAILLAVFVFLNPIWKQHDMGAWNENIWWSYLPIPLLVAVLLRVEGKFSWPALGFESMKLTFTKFALTITIAGVIWEVRGIPGTGIESAPAMTDSAKDAYAVQPAPAATLLLAEDLGRVTGTLTNGQGQPVPQALIYVSQGLEAFRFAAPESSVQLVNTGAGFEPNMTVLQTHQVLTLHSESDALHTAVFRPASSKGAHTGQRLLNYPLIPRGDRSLMFDREFGLLELTCSVHGDAELASTVLVLHHPFWTRTDTDGRFSLDGVPAGELELSIERANGTLQRESARVTAPKTLVLPLMLRN